MKRRISTPADDLETPVPPVAETIVVTPVPGRVGPLLHTVSNRVGPLAQTAVARIGATAVLVSPYAQSAASRVVPIARTAAARVTPVAQSAAGRVTPLAQQAAGRVGPYAQQAVQRVGPLAGQAVGLATPYALSAQQAARKVVPLAATATQRGAQVASDAVENFRPKLDEALGKVSPTVDAARTRVTQELLPRLSGAFVAAAGAPVLSEATKRGKATLAAARGELTFPESPPVRRRATSWLTRLGIAAAVAGVAAVVVRKSLGHKDADWQTARPTTPRPGGQPAAGPSAPTPGQDHDAPQIDATNLAVSGVYIGSEPPATFLIKGNERTKQFYTPDAVIYDMLIGEVWFSSEAAAADHGYTRAEN